MLIKNFVVALTLIAVGCGSGGGGDSSPEGDSGHMAQNVDGGVAADASNGSGNGPCLRPPASREHPITLTSDNADWNGLDGFAFMKGFRGSESNRVANLIFGISSTNDRCDLPWSIEIRVHDAQMGENTITGYPDGVSTDTHLFFVMPRQSDANFSRIVSLSNSDMLQEFSWDEVLWVSTGGTITFDVVGHRDRMLDDGSMVSEPVMAGRFDIAYENSEGATLQLQGTFPEPAPE